MPDSVKRKTLGFLLLGIVFIILLATGLSQLELQPGQPFPSFETIQGMYAPLETPPQTGASIRSAIGLAVLFAALVLYMFYKLLRGASWKDILTPSLFFGLMLLIIIGLLLALLAVVSSPGEVVPEPVYLPPEVELVTSPLGETPSWLLRLVWIGLALLAAVLGVWLARAMRAPAQRDPLLWEAEQALNALHTGQDLKSVILRCYQRMSQAVEADQGLQREQAMTASEFEQELIGRGMPPGAVHQLTRLFEAVRYGRWQPAADDEQKAYDCLNAIVQASQEKKAIEA